MAKKIDLASKPGYGWEYAAIRGEALKRIELRQQLISITLTLAGIFLSVGLSNELVPLVYPPLAMFLAFGWAQNDFRIRKIAQYQRDHLESLDIGLNYETAMQADRFTEKGMGAWRFVVISHSGIFLFTQAMAVAIDLLRSGLRFDPLRICLLAVDGVAIALVFWITRRVTSRTEN